LLNFSPNNWFATSSTPGRPLFSRAKNHILATHTELHLELQLDQRHVAGVAQQQQLLLTSTRRQKTRCQVMRRTAAAATVATGDLWRAKPRGSSSSSNSNSSNITNSNIST